MKVLKGFVHQEAAGTNGEPIPFPDRAHLRLPRDASAIPHVMGQIHTAKFQSRVFIWRANMLRSDSSDLVLGNIGKTRNANDLATWDSVTERWIFRGKPSEAATEFIIQLSTKTLLMRKSPRLSDSPIQVAKALEELMNRTLAVRWPDSAWSFNLDLRRNTHEFERRLGTLVSVRSIKADIAAPNARSDNWLRQMRGTAGECGGDMISVSIQSRKSAIDLASGYIVRLRKLVTEGLVRLRVRGQQPEGTTGRTVLVTVDSQAVAKPVEQDIHVIGTRMQNDNALKIVEGADDFIVDGFNNGDDNDVGHE